MSLAYTLLYLYFHFSLFVCVNVCVSEGEYLQYHKIQHFTSVRERWDAERGWMEGYAERALDRAHGSKRTHTRASKPAAKNIPLHCGRCDDEGMPPSLSLFLSFSLSILFLAQSLVFSPGCVCLLTHTQPSYLIMRHFIL